MFRFLFQCEESLRKLYKLQEQSSKGSKVPKLMFLFSPEIVSSLNFKVQDLGNWADDDKASFALDMNGLAQ